MHETRSKYALLLIVLLASGCSIFSADDEIEPAKLQKINAQIELSQQWKKGTPSDNNGFWPSLEIAADNKAIYTADHSGSVVSLDIASGEKNWSTDIDHSISGGVGFGGNKVLLGTFNAGTTLGWFLVPNGWDGGQQIVEEEANRFIRFSNAQFAVDRYPRPARC